VKEFIKNSQCFFQCIDHIAKAESRLHVLDKVVEEIREYLDCDRCSLFIYDKKSNNLCSKVAQKLKSKVVCIPANRHSITGYTFITGETIYADDAYDEKELKRIDPHICVSEQWDKTYRYKTKSVLATPINARGKRVGVFLALNKKGGFIPYSVEALKEYAPLVGLALEIVLLDEALNGKVKSFDDLVVVTC
jgi:GAF domain-containing protein